MIRKPFVPYAIFDPVTDMIAKVGRLIGVRIGHKIAKKAISLGMKPDEVALEVLSFRQLLMHNHMLYKFEEFIQ